MPLSGASSLSSSSQFEIIKWLLSHGEEETSELHQPPRGRVPERFTMNKRSRIGCRMFGTGAERNIAGQR
jgi:hypothetical protein